MCIYLSFTCVCICTCVIIFIYTTHYLTLQKTQRTNDEVKKKQQKAVQKQNKRRKVCTCLKEMANDKENKELWLNCFDCC